MKCFLTSSSFFFFFWLYFILLFTRYFPWNRLIFLKKTYSCWKGNFFFIAAGNGQHISLVVKNRKWLWKINSMEGGLHVGVAEAQGLRSVTSLLQSETSKYLSGIKVRSAPPWDFLPDHHWEKRTEKRESVSPRGSPVHYTWPKCLPGSPTISGGAHWPGDTHLPILQLRAEVSCQIHWCWCLFLNKQCFVPCCLSKEFYFHIILLNGNMLKYIKPSLFVKLPLSVIPNEGRLCPEWQS